MKREAKKVMGMNESNEKKKTKDMGNYKRNEMKG